MPKFWHEFCKRKQSELSDNSWHGFCKRSCQNILKISLVCERMFYPCAGIDWIVWKFWIEKLFWFLFLIFEMKFFPVALSHFWDTPQPLKLQRFWLLEVISISLLRLRLSSQNWDVRIVRQFRRFRIVLIFRIFWKFWNRFSYCRLGDGGVEPYWKIFPVLEKFVISSKLCQSFQIFP